MSTVKYKQPSPYVSPVPTPPPEDYLFKQYESDLNLENSSSSVRPVNIALFGAGRAGTIHLATIARNARTKVLYVVEDMIEKHDKLKKYWHLEDVTMLHSKDSQKVFDDPRVDAIVITTPTSTHEDIIVAALNAKKAVFCEKPIAQTLENTKKCYKKAEEVGKPLFCAFNKRFDPAYVSVKERVHAGEVGHVHTIKLCSKDSQVPPISYLKTSGGLFIDTCVHEIDVMCWILGELPIQVSVTATAMFPEIAAIGDFDTALITFKFPSGTIGIIDSSRHCSYGFDQRVEVSGFKGMIRADNVHPVASVDSLIGFEGNKRSNIWFTFPSRYREAYTREMEHFLDVVQGKTTPLVKGTETLAVSKIAQACSESARNRKFVDIKWSPEELPKSE